MVYAGEGRRERAVVVPGEEECLLGPLPVRRFTVASLDCTSRRARVRTRVVVWPASASACQQ
ncbi:hypothetical protein AB0N23_18830 [Streptomyces sp. NPDC052644]